MRRRFLGQAIGLSLAGLVGARGAGAQQPKGKPRIAYVYIFKEGPSAPFSEDFRKRLRELGWIDGENIIVEIRDAEGSPDKLNAIMRELVDSKIDVIVTACTPEAKVAVKYTSTIPIVMAATGDPVAAGLVASLAKPGGNVTGVSAMLLDLSAERLEILKDAFPNVSRATVVWNPGRPDNGPEVPAMQATATKLGVRLDSVEVRSVVELNDALDMLATSGTQAMFNTGDPLLSNQELKLVAVAAKLRIPTIFENREYVDLGGLMSFGPNFPLLHRRAADYVDKILKGAKPGDLPIEQPTKFEFVINMKTAKALGFAIPQSVLLRADEVIQ
jgi:putative tryptophan/tyrosine transport system substrate-binding protein